VPDALLRDAAYWMKLADQARRSGLYEIGLKYYSRGLELDRALVAGWLGQVQMLVELAEYPEAELWARKALELFPSNGDLMAGRAQAFCRLSNGKQAYATCDGSLQQAGQSAYRWLVRGEILLASRRGRDEHCFDKAQQLDPDWLVPLEAGRIYLHYGRPSLAVPRLRRAVEAAPEAAYAWYVLGTCQAELGFKKPARESFRRCLDLSPRHEGAGEELRHLGKWSISPLRWLRRLTGRL
jgi:tetratricopeptide (TPR) repeat protein